MDLFTRNPENNKIQYHVYVGEIMFSDILEQIDNEKDLKFVVTNLCNDLETVVHDWYIDNNKEDNFDNCNIEVYFETKD